MQGFLRTIPEEYGLFLVMYLGILIPFMIGHLWGIAGLSFRRIPGWIATTVALTTMLHETGQGLEWMQSVPTLAAVMCIVGVTYGHFIGIWIDGGRTS